MSSSYRYTLLPDATLSSERFVSEALEKQKLLIDGQDRDLEKVGDSVSILRNMSHKIGDELDDHAVILDELGTEMEQTSARIDGLVKKIARISNLNDDRRQWTVIIVLSLILFFLILLFIIL